MTKPSNIEFSPMKAKKDTADMLMKLGISKEEAERMATAQVESMGIYKIATNKCPRGETSPMACMLCSTGHMTHCHYPLTCRQAGCSHYQESDNPEDYYADNVR